MPPSGGARTSLTYMLGPNGIYEQTFQSKSGLFSPGAPLTPADPQPVRRIDFAPGLNANTTPRAPEPFGFPALRAFSNVELVRLAIETRKDQIERLDWQVRPKGGRRARKDAEERIRAAERFLRKPDGVTHFATWLRLAVEDLLVLDAPAFEKRRNRGGGLIALDVVPGDTIKLLVDQDGRRPLAPAPAYQQIIKGRVWADLTTDDLIYSPRNPRPNKLYGFGPVEQIIVTINTSLRRQASQLAYFTEGNIPAGMATVPDGWTPDQIKEWQGWFDAILAGNLGERRKLIWGPFGTKVEAFKEAPIKDEFDEWLARVVCFAFSLPATPFIRQMNRSTSEEDQSRSEDEGVAPLLLWAKRLLDGVVQDDLGFPDLEFSWNTAVEIDPDTQSQIDDRDLKVGKVSLDEVRDRAGLDPLPGGAGSEPMIYTATGAIPVSLVRAGAEAALKAAEQAGKADPNQTSGDPADTE